MTRNFANAKYFEYLELFCVYLNFSFAKYFYLKAQQYGISENQIRVED